MMIFRALSVSALALTLFITAVHAQDVSLKEAERLALDNDPLARQFQSSAQAQQDLSVADAQWPDPELRFGALNIPTDTFDTDQEAMTQFQVGIAQQIPSFGSLEAKAAIAQALSRVDGESERARKLMTLRAVRLAWLDALYWDRSLAVLADYKSLLEDDIRSVQAIYSSGRISAQRVMAAELASSLLDDRAIEAKRNLDVAKVTLGKWTGENLESLRLQQDTPSFANPRAVEIFEQDVLQHPVLKALNEQEAAADQKVLLAESEYGPKFGVGAAYGYRQDTPMGAPRADLVSVQFNMSLPFFTGARQDRRLSAQKHQAAAARLRWEEQLREMVREYRTDLAELQRTHERLKNFDHEIIKRAKDNVAAAITAYQYEASDFDALVRARVSELEAQLKRLRLEIDSAKALVRLQYLQGETL